MEGNELSHSEYLKCNNACVKVTINRYRGLCLEEISRNHRYSLAERITMSIITGMPLLLGNAYVFHKIFQNVLAKAGECKATDLSSLKAVFGCIGIVMEIDQLPSLARTVAITLVCMLMVRLLQELVERFDQRHASLRFCLLRMLHNFVFPCKQPDFQRLLQYIEQDFEPKEIHHGSGFVIADNFVITNKHVIEEAMSDKTLQVRILNETIGDMRCVVAHYDAGSDLALLYCHGLNSKQLGICPLDLSEEALWPSLSVFSFGYPFTHTGRSALFVEGKVSGSEERYGREPLVVLNCALNPGNSGGPVFCRIGGDIKVVGVVAQKHKKDILTLEEINILEEERSALNSASDSRDHFRKSLLLKMYDALNETHCQFGYGNMVPGHLVVKFLSGHL